MKKFTSKAAVSALAAPLLFSSWASTESSAAKQLQKTEAAVQLEALDRGLQAVPTSSGVFLSWRLLGNEVDGYAETGLAGVDFHVYKNGKKISTVENSTNFVDKTGTSASAYFVRAVKNGAELNQSDTVRPWEKGYYDLKLQKPADGVTPVGEPYTYSANDMSVGDVNGDGQFEFFVKWDPSNSKDVSQVGYTGNTYIDCYTFEGDLLYRIDLGVNIRSGAHYTQFLVYDFDGDGKAEAMFKTAPGTKITRYSEEGTVLSENYITMPKKDVNAGYANTDDYRMSSADYYGHIVDMFKNWHKHEEVVNGNWPGTLEESFGIEPRYEYPLSQENAEALADYFMDEYAPARSSRNQLRKFEGFVLTGPEYITVFNGETGEELETVPYKISRHDDGLMWGDYAMSRIEPGNRVDRFLAGVAYLDGKTPSAVFARGYYTRAALVSYNWDGEHLSEVWTTDSGWTPMDNPFHASPHGTSGKHPEHGALANQGAHFFSTADVDADGKQEIVYGSATVDHDGSLLYSSTDTLPPQSAAPGETAKLGHGDAIHVTDIDPERDGLEIFMVHEGASYAPYGYAMRDAKTGKVLWGGYTGKDTGRGMIGDIDPSKAGLETWAVDVRTADGEKIGSKMPGTNMSIKWAPDMTTQIVNGSGSRTPVIEDWQKGVVLSAGGTRTNNGTKGNPSLVADVFGDWREELMLRTEDSSAIRFFTSTGQSSRKMYTLMHDVQYRTGIAGQNMAYNQPAYTGFSLASDTAWAKVPQPDYAAPGTVLLLERLLDEAVQDGTLSSKSGEKALHALKQALHHAEIENSQQALFFLEKLTAALEKENAESVKLNASFFVNTLKQEWQLAE